MAKTRKPRPSFDTTPPPVPTTAAGGWAYRSDVAPKAPDAAAPAPPSAAATTMMTARAFTPVGAIAPPPRWVAAVVTPFALGAAIALAPLTWISRRGRR